MAPTTSTYAAWRRLSGRPRRHPATDRSGNEVVHADITTWVTPAG
ncbi:MAG: hypothetical protein WA622_05285 [Mycobacterium sp.]